MSQSIVAFGASHFSFRWLARGGLQIWHEQTRHDSEPTHALIPLVPHRWKSASDLSGTHVRNRRVAQGRC